MTYALLEPHKKWRDEVIYHLRMKDVPGDRIGDILLEVESHIQESGETPEQAFGSSKQYASIRAADAAGRKTSTWSLMAIGLLSGAGSFFYVYGAMGVGEGVETVTALDLNPWIPLLAGLVVLLLMGWRLPNDGIRHPATGRPLLGGSDSRFKPILLVIVLMIGVVFALLGRLLAG